MPPNRVPVRWRVLGLLSGAGPGLVTGGLAAFAGDLISPGVGRAGPTIAVLFVTAVALAIGGAVALAARRRAQAGLPWSNPAMPAILTALVVMFATAALLPDKIAALVAIAAGAILRVVVAASVGLAQSARPK